jgi:hypothetical protein
VELMVALLQSKYGIGHPATSSHNNREFDEEIDPIPHQIRGTLVNFSQIQLNVSNYLTELSYCNSHIILQFFDRAKHLIVVLPVRFLLSLNIVIVVLSSYEMFVQILLAIFSKN